jgi:hypothetical protein
MNRRQRRAMARDAFRANRGESPLPKNRSSAPSFVKPRAVSAAFPGGVGGPIHIEVQQFVLRGFDGTSAHRIAAAFEHELQSLLERTPLPFILQSPGSISRLTLPPIRIGRSTDWRSVAAQLAYKFLDMKKEPRR